MCVNIFIKNIITFLYLITLFINCKLLNASEPPHVYCYTNFILVELPLTSTNHTDLFLRHAIHWENSNSNSPKDCSGLSYSHGLSWKISTKDLFKCGFWRIINKWQNSVTYHQNLIIKQPNGLLTKNHVKCLYKIKEIPQKLIISKLVKRSALPEDFHEDTDLEILDTLEQQAPEPQITMEVRQNDVAIDDMVTVIPGTPLAMQIKLNEESNTIYGLTVNNLQVTDMAEMSETILFRGCTVDPYLFENFHFTQNNSLKAKFRAFKFPSSAFVQFRANVQICLQHCVKPHCVASTTKSARRRRREAAISSHNLYEISSSFVVKINASKDSNGADLLELQNHVEQLHAKNIKLLTLK